MTADFFPRPGVLQPVTDVTGYSYLLSLPREATAQSARRWPLFLFLHGAGERGANVEDVARQGAPRLLAGPPNLTPSEQAAALELAGNFIVIAPQCPALEVWDEAMLLALLDRALKKYPVDPARIYLIGLSMGGFGAWSLAMRHPGRFDALVAICGGGRVADVLTARRNQEAELRRMGIWAFHGECDVVVPLEESQRMIAAVQDAGVADVRFTVYPNGQHDAWTETFANGELYAWLLRHARPDGPR